MFERYTEKARRVIFFARYEASLFGSRYIETEHILLGLVREDKGLALTAIPEFSAQSIREEIENATTIGEQVPTSVDLPVSNDSKRVLSYAAEEADLLSSEHIGTEHLLIGLLRETNCFAARILQQRGVTLESFRLSLNRTTPRAAGSFSIGKPGEMQSHDPGLRAEARGALRRPMVFRRDGDDAHLGDTFSIDVPRVGDEISIENTRGSVTRLTYHYKKVDHVVDGRAASLIPEKVVVYVKVLNNEV